MILEKAINHGGHGEHGVESEVWADCCNGPLGEGYKGSKPEAFPVRPVFPVVHMQF